jgi:hypothetical protein
MNETQIRERVRDAVGPANYPAGFSSRIEAGLKEAYPMRTHRIPSRPIRGPWLAGLGRTGTLAAALLVVVLMAAAIVGVHAWLTGGLFNIHPASPTLESPNVMHYQDLLASDEQSVLDAQSSNCSTLTDACPAAAGRVAAALQKWLDDLNGIRPPAKFAYVDAQMRRHIALTIADLNAAVVAYNAHDQNGMERAINAAVSGRDAFVAEVTDIATSTQMPAAEYLNTVRADKTSLLGCSWCMRLATENTAVCQAAQLPSCAEDIAATRNTVDAFQGDLVRLLAPDALVAKDSQLQADIFAADSALNTMDSALAAHDQAALSAGHDALVRALAKVTADAAAIVG